MEDSEDVYPIETDRNYIQISFQTICNFMHQSV